MINSCLESKEALPIITVAGRKTCILGKGEETQLSSITTLEHTLSLMQGHVHKGPGMSHGESRQASFTRVGKTQVTEAPGLATGSQRLVFCDFIQKPDTVLGNKLPGLGHCCLMSCCLPHPPTGQLSIQKGTHMVL